MLMITGWFCNKNIIIKVKLLIILPKDKIYPSLWFEFLLLLFPNSEGQILSGPKISESSFGKFPVSFISATISPMIWQRYTAQTLKKI